MSTRIRYTEEFKREAVSQVVERRHSVCDLTDETIRAWLLPRVDVSDIWVAGTRNNPKTG
jgi:hypothetical protein